MGACPTLIAVIPIVSVTILTDRILALVNLDFQGMVEVAQAIFLFKPFQALSCYVVDYNILEHHEALLHELG